MNVYPPGYAPSNVNSNDLVTKAPSSTISYKGLNLSNGWIMAIGIVVMALMTQTRYGAIAVLAIALSATIYQLVDKKAVTS